MERFTVGTQVRLHGAFRREDRDVDPSGAVSITVRRPDGTVSSVEPDRLSAGHFSLSVLLDMPGRWAVRVAAAGESATEQEFYVEPSLIGN